MLEHRGNFTLCFAASFAELSQRLAGARVKASPGESRNLPASPDAHSRGYWRGFAGRAGVQGALIPGISSSLAPRLQPWHISSYQQLATLTPQSHGELGTCCAGTVHNCRSSAGVWRRGRLRGEGKLQPKPPATPWPASVGEGWCLRATFGYRPAASLLVNQCHRIRQPPPCTLCPSGMLPPASSQHDAVSKQRTPLFPAVTREAFPRK